LTATPALAVVFKSKNVLKVTTTTIVSANVLKNARLAVFIHSYLNLKRVSVNVRSRNAKKVRFKTPIPVSAAQNCSDVADWGAGCLFGSIVTSVSANALKNKNVHQITTSTKTNVNASKKSRFAR